MRATHRCEFGAQCLQLICCMLPLTAAQQRKWHWHCWTTCFTERSRPCQTSLAKANMARSSWTLSWSTASAVSPPEVASLLNHPPKCSISHICTQKDNRVVRLQGLPHTSVLNQVCVFNFWSFGSDYSGQICEVYRLHLCLYHILALNQASLFQIFFSCKFIKNCQFSFWKQQFISGFSNDLYTLYLSLCLYVSFGSTLNLSLSAAVNHFWGLTPFDFCPLEKKKNYND